MHLAERDRNLPSPMEWLRDQTKGAHVEAETELDRLAPWKTLEAYRILIARLWIFYDSVESKISATGVWDQLELDASDRQKKSLLQADLLALGLEIPSRCSVAGIHVGSVAEALGCLYVIEGSSLGGQVIASRLKRRLGAEVPCNYFVGSGKATGRNWREFGCGLNKYFAESGNLNSAVSAAEVTFRTMTYYMTAKDLRFA